MGATVPNKFIVKEIFTGPGSPMMCGKIRSALLFFFGISDPLLGPAEKGLVWK
jgi:hypothetical protein